MIITQNPIVLARQFFLKHTVKYYSIRQSVCGNPADCSTRVTHTCTVSFSLICHLGNHELWIRPRENIRDSIAKHKKILQMCDRIGVYTKPAKFFTAGNNHVWIVPLFSWLVSWSINNKFSLYIKQG